MSADKASEGMIKIESRESLIKSEPNAERYESAPIKTEKEEATKAKRLLRSHDKKPYKRIRSCSPSAFLEADLDSRIYGMPNKKPRHAVKEKADAMLKAVSYMYYRPKNIDTVGFGDKWSADDFNHYQYSTLDLLLTPLRKSHVMDSWTPKEIALFEAAMCSVGKDFHAIQQIIKTKRTNDIIDFYYAWKLSSHYQIWKDLGKPSRKFHSGKPEQWATIADKMAGIKYESYIPKHQDEPASTSNSESSLSSSSSNSASHSSSTSSSSSNANAGKHK
jgi:hypothetical protein